MEQVELRHAWVWDCSECGRENLDRGVALNEEEREAILKAYGFPQHTVLIHPRVSCKFCDAIFETVNPDG